ncbi:tail protein X [Kushneria phyllosphaerae]|uniref:Phage tail protein X n=1 Tax=Kushneria phyllosphaerae TaxID=2100822 RepID=A0A2R8CKI6_9GAMM|nr:tail protein X [Kushneria phyllosphaerae]SPJ33417.1 hypothetical protein KSP9073_01426 [Kushneria phyllosphaerae]
MARTVRAVQGDTVDALCYRHYGGTKSLVERVYEHNPGLSELGPILPMGTAVTLPDINTPPSRARVQLWD